MVLFFPLDLLILGDQICILIHNLRYLVAPATCDGVKSPSPIVGTCSPGNITSPKVQNLCI